MKVSKGFKIAIITIFSLVALGAILVAVSAVNIRGTSRSCLRVSATFQTLSVIVTAIQAWEVKTGTLPDSLEQLTVETDDAPAVLTKGSLYDSWGNAFQYTKIGTHRFEVRSAGPNGIMGDDDDIFSGSN